MMLNLNLTIIELIKVLNTIKGLGFKRTIVYYHLSLRLNNIINICFFPHR